MTKELLSADIESIESTLSRFLEKFEKDTKIESLSHGLDLHLESLKTNNLLIEWTNIYIIEKRKLKKLYSVRDKLLLKLKNYYSGRASPDEYEKAPLNDKILRTELDVWIRADSRWTDLQKVIESQESIVELGERACDVLKTRAFLIKDALRYLEFINGQ